MSDDDLQSVPLSLFLTGRAQCPDCGAPLGLADNRPLVRCEFCGGTSVVQRRLRTLEPVISDGFITADAPQDTARGIRPSQVIAGVAQDESHCPTCGYELEAGGIQAIRVCPSCGTQSKIERRLLRSPDADAALDALEQNAEAYEQRHFAETEALVVTIESSADLAERVRAARSLGENWLYANARAARLLPRILSVLRTADPRLEIPLGEIIGKLLCNDNIVLVNAVLRAAEKFVFDVAGSHALLRQLSLGSGIGLKLLLDAADYAGTRGAIDYACSALWAVNTMIERNYAGRMRLAEIVLYRLLYLRGPVQAWALQLLQGQMGLGCRFPTPTLLHFIDDCAAERAELVPQIHKCFYDGRAGDDAEYLARLEFLSQLHTPAAKAAAIEHIHPPEDAVSDDAVGACMQRLLALVEDEQLGPAAVQLIAGTIDEGAEPPRACVTEMVRRHGDKLPEAIRKAYIRKVPKTPLLTPIEPWHTDPPAGPRTAFDEQLEQWKNQWDEGIRRAVDANTERREAAREYWESIKGG